MTTYESRFEPKQCGDYVAHIELFGSPITGAPVHITCVAAVPDVSKSQFTVPEPPLFQNEVYDVVLRAVDKYGNACTRGGAAIIGRLQCAAMPHGQDSNVPVEDVGDGTYILRVCLVAPADIKLITTINTGKEKSEKAGSEFPQINMQFQSTKAKDAVKKAEKEMANHMAEKASEKNKSFKKPNQRLQAAGKENISAMGDAQERRKKTLQAEEVAQLAVDAFMEAGEVVCEEAKVCARRRRCHRRQSSRGSVGGPIDGQSSRGSVEVHRRSILERQRRRSHRRPILERQRRRYHRRPILERQRRRYNRRAVVGRRFNPKTPKSGEVSAGGSTPKTPKSADGGSTPKTPKSAKPAQLRKQGSFLSSGTTPELGGKASVSSPGESSSKPKTPRGSSSKARLQGPDLILDRLGSSVPTGELLS